MRVLHALDDTLIERVFQPALNRIQVSGAMRSAVSCYALYASMQVGRALVLHAHGMLGERAPYVALDVAAVCYTYGLAVLFGHDAPSGPCSARHNPMFRAARLVSLALTLWRFAAMLFVRQPDAETLLSWGGYALWGAGLNFEGCASPPPRPKRKAVPDATANVI